MNFEKKCRAFPSNRNGGGGGTSEGHWSSRGTHSSRSSDACRGAAGARITRIPRGVGGVDVLHPTSSSSSRVFASLSYIYTRTLSAACELRLRNSLAQRIGSGVSGWPTYALIARVIAADKASINRMIIPVEDSAGSASPPPLSLSHARSCASTPV